MTTDPVLTSAPSRARRSPAPRWRSRNELDLTAQQLQAVARFNQARRTAETASAAVARSRELAMDVARSLEVLRREHDAVVARAHEQLRVAGDPQRGTPERRVVIAHRNEWFVAKVAEALQECGFRLVAQVDNGADAVGVAVAEQPDLIVVEDTLAMVPGEQVVRDVRTYCPQTLVAAQVAYGDRVGPLLQAGAATVFTRQVSPSEAVRSMLALLAAA